MEKNQGSRDECPYKSAGRISRLLLWWISKYLWTALKRPLNHKDIQHTHLPWVYTDRQVNHFSTLWPNRDARTGQPCSSLALALARHVWKQIVLTSLLAFICEGLKFSYPFLIVQIIGYFEQAGQVSASIAWGCAGLMVANNLLYGLLQINYTYMNQVVSMQLRTTCSGLIYRKLLTINTRIEGSPTAGHITSLLSTDVERFEKVLYSCQALLVAPVLFIAFILLESGDLGMSILAGAAFITGFELIRLCMGKLQAATRRKSLKWTDKRSQLVNELFSAIRTVKMYCWEKPFSDKASKLRRKETSCLRLGIFLEAFGSSLNHSAGAIVTYFIVLTFVYSGHTLTAAIAVKLIGLIRFIEAMVFIAFPTSIANIMETLVSVQRIETFLLHDRSSVNKVEHVEVPQSNVSVEVQGLSAKWETSKDQSETVALEDVNLSAKSGELVAVLGTVGAGKTSLLMACLGELPLKCGSVRMRGRVALVPQEPWIVPASVQANVVMDTGNLDIERYRQALNVCQLNQDLTEMPHQDQTSVGEKGLALSGGQKARINLARAVYSNADIYLLDSPLSSLDSKVAAQVFDECICGALENKLRILVTHNLDYLQKADKVIVMDKGRLVAVGQYDDVAGQIQLTDYVCPEKPIDYLSPATPPDQQYSYYDDEEDIETMLAEWDRRQRQLMMGKTSNGHQRKKNKKKKADKERLISTEKESVIGKWSERECKEDGTVSGHVYLSYFRMGYGAVLGPLFILSLVLMTAADILAEWWMASWYHDGDTSGQNTSNSNSFHLVTTSNSSLVSQSTTELPPMYTTNQRVIVLSIFLSVNVLMGVIQSLLLAFMCVYASRSIYDSMFKRVLRAPMYFFEKNSLGAVLNRFTRDTSFVDTKVPAILAIGAPAPILGLGLLIFTCIISPWATIAAIPLIIALPLICSYTMNGIRDLKRIEASLRSPTFTHLSATLQGTSVIRAFNLEQEFIRESASRMDAHASSWCLYLTAERFLSLMTFFIVTLFHAITLLIMLLLPQHAIEAGPKGLALTYIRFLIAYMRLSTMKFTSLETYMTSVERLLQYSNLPQEAPEHTDVHPAPGWPREGDLRLSNVCLQYGDTFRTSLGPLNLHIQPGQKVAIVGRTGAGKTSLFACLLRLTDPTGSIRIDGLETTVLGLTDLRSNISVIPQDPILFSGPLRKNLDPTDKYNDDQVWYALKQVQMLRAVRDLPGGLYGETGDGGSNFSSGQKQLLCLARALLRNNKIIMFDEATSNVDRITESLIQDTLTKVLVKKTVLSIAHRLETVISYDKVLVLDKGRRVQYDHPYNLLRNQSGLFYQLVNQSGNSMTKQLTEKAHAFYKISKYKNRPQNEDSQSD